MRDVPRNGFACRDQVAGPPALLRRVGFNSDPTVIPWSRVTVTYLADFKILIHEITQTAGFSNDPNPNYGGLDLTDGIWHRVSAVSLDNHFN
jgi:hypothetical protein